MNLSNPSGEGPRRPEQPHRTPQWWRSRVGAPGRRWLLSRAAALRELALDLLALLWPTACVGCEAPDRELCDGCRQRVEDPTGSEEPLSVPGLGVPCYAATGYDGPTRSVLLAYKHQGMYGFVRPLGRRLASVLGHALSDVYPSRPLVVPLPSRPRRVRERGWRHVDELVRVALRTGRFPLAQRAALRTLRGRTGQVGLGEAGRERNARRIAVRGRDGRRLRGLDVILVDDIVTTGATVRAAIAVLERAGAEVLAVVALCAAPRRDAPQKTEWNLTGERG